jgi:hypothetical protein
MRLRSTVALHLPFIQTRRFTTGRRKRPGPGPGQLVNEPSHISCTTTTRQQQPALSPRTLVGLLGAWVWSRSAPLNESGALGKTVTNTTPGTMQETGEPLDFAMEGKRLHRGQDLPRCALPRDGQFTPPPPPRSSSPTHRPPCSARMRASKSAATGTVPVSAVGVFEVPGAVKWGEKLDTGQSLLR